MIHWPTADESLFDDGTGVALKEAVISKPGVAPCRESTRDTCQDFLESESEVSRDTASPALQTHSICLPFCLNPGRSLRLPLSGEIAGLISLL